MIQNEEDKWKHTGLSNQVLWDKIRESNIGVLGVSEEGKIQKSKRNI